MQGSENPRWGGGLKDIWIRWAVRAAKPNSRPCFLRSAVLFPAWRIERFGRIQGFRSWST